MSSVRNLLLSSIFSRFRKSVLNRLLTFGLASHNLSQNFIKPFSVRQLFRDHNAFISSKRMFPKHVALCKTEQLLSILKRHCAL